MDGLEFQFSQTPLPVNPARVDIAFFAGFVARRPFAAQRSGESETAFLTRVLSANLLRWLDRYGWLGRDSHRTTSNLAALENVPVPIENWDTFDALFDWENRVVDPAGRRCDTRLGAAIRDFFSQGGRKCYIVRVGDPWPLGEPRANRIQRLAALFPMVPPPTAVDRSSWFGVGHLFGLPDVSFAILPDLADIVSADISPVFTERAPESEERFIECADRAIPESASSLRQISAPRCDREGFGNWRNFVARVGDFLADRRNRLREVQFLAAIPLPIRELDSGHDPVVRAAAAGQRLRVSAQRAADARRAQWEESGQIRTAFVQLCYPWLRTQLSRRLPEELTAPDGVLAGTISRNALTAGTWTSALSQPIPGLTAVVPIIDPSEQRSILPFPAGTPMSPRTFRERVSLFGVTVDGFRLISDVTTDDDETYRPANVNRLVSTIVRAARVTGETLVFDNNGPALWTQLRNSLRSMLAALWAEGALNGANASEAFEVVCDRSTMTQADLDAGRLIARIGFKPAAPIERIVVVLAVDGGGQVTLLSTRTRETTGGVG